MPDYTRRFEVITRARTFVFAECGGTIPPPSSGPAPTSEKRGGSEGRAAGEAVRAGNALLRQVKPVEGVGKEGDANVKGG